MLATLVLLAALTPSPHASPADVALHFETVEASSVEELDGGRVTFSRQVTIAGGDRFQYRYTDPRDGHEYRLDFTLTPQSGNVVAVALEWRDASAGELRLERDDLAVDGTMSLSLYPLPDGRGEVFLRLAPTVVAATR